MDHFVAVAVFMAALTALLIYVAMVAQQYMYWRLVEMPISPGGNMPTRVVYVYNSSDGLYLVEYGGDVERFRKYVGPPGELVAVFELYPGGYRCEARRPVRVGDPYTGLWCPPPYGHSVNTSSCTPVGLASRGRWLVAQYRCP
ncbi:MAG: hypothetical protein ACK4SY_00510 [Pyrobaculum sp.]